MYNVHIEVESLVYIYIYIYMYVCICRFKNDIFPCGIKQVMFKTNDHIYVVVIHFTINESVDR